jgi:hypothetical protein
MTQQLTIPGLVHEVRELRNDLRELFYDKGAIDEDGAGVSLVQVLHMLVKEMRRYNDRRDAEG